MIKDIEELYEKTMKNQNRKPEDKRTSSLLDDNKRIEDEQKATRQAIEQHQ